MNWLVERDPFTAALTALATLARRGTLPVTHQRVLAVATDDGTLALTATDTETWATVRLPADVTTPGSALVPADIVGDWAVRAPSAQIRLTTPDAGAVRLAWDATHYLHLRADPPDAFPPAPPPPPPSAPLALTADTLRRARQWCLPALGHNHPFQPITEGLWLYQEPDQLHLTASDGTRLSRLTVPQPGLPAADPVAVPPWLFDHLARVTEEDVQLALGDRLAYAAAGPWTVTARLLKGRIPDVSRVLPTTFTTTIAADARALRGALSRLGLLGHLGSQALSIQWDVSPAGLHLTTHSEVATGDEWVDATVTGEPLTIAFAWPLLMDATRLVGSGPLTIELTGEQGPSRWHLDDAAAFHVLLPLRKLAPV